MFFKNVYIIASFSFLVVLIPNIGLCDTAEFLVNTYTNDAQQHPAIAMDSEGNFVIAWESNGQDGSELGIFAQRYDKDRIPQGSEFQVNSTTLYDQFYPSAQKPT